MKKPFWKRVYQHERTGDQFITPSNFTSKEHGHHTGKPPEGVRLVAVLKVTLK